MSSLRVVEDETPPLSVSELKDRGDKLLADARRHMITALHESTHPELFKSGSFKPNEVGRLHRRAKHAVQAWMNVEAALGELVREFNKANATARKR